MIPRQVYLCILRSLFCSIMHIHMLAYAHTQIHTHTHSSCAMSPLPRRKTARPSWESERVPSFYFSVAFHASFISLVVRAGAPMVLSWIISWPEFGIVHIRELANSLSLSLSIVSGGLTVNSELYVRIYVCACACAGDGTIHAFVKFFRSWHEKRSLYTMRVWATSRLNVITDQPDDRISLTLPFLLPSWPSSTFPFSSFAPRPTESAYVQSLQSLWHRW